MDRASALIQDWLTEAGVKRRVLLPKLIPDFLIGLSTCSSSAAFSTTLEINEKKLGIDPSFSRTAVPIGTIIYAGISSLFLIVSCAYAAECYQVGANLAWWIILWFIGTLLTMAVPPVAGGGISCLSILLIQMHVPREGLAIVVTLSMFLDFIYTAARIFTMHIETALLADRLGLLDREMLQRNAEGIRYPRHRIRRCLFMKKRILLLLLCLCLLRLIAGCVSVPPAGTDGVSPSGPAATPTSEPEQTTEPTPEPEPTAAPTPEPTAEPTPEPTPEPTAEPTPEPTAEPTLKPTPEPKDGESESGDKADPEEAGAREYVLNLNSKKFHYPWCSSVDKMKEKNRLDYTGTREEIIEMGYEPCKNCNP